MGKIQYIMAVSKKLGILFILFTFLGYPLLAEDINFSKGKFVSAYENSDGERLALWVSNDGKREHLVYGHKGSNGEYVLQQVNTGARDPLTMQFPIVGNKGSEAQFRLDPKTGNYEVQCGVFKRKFAPMPAAEVSSWMTQSMRKQVVLKKLPSASEKPLYYFNTSSPPFLHIVVTQDKSSGDYKLYQGSSPISLRESQTVTISKEPDGTIKFMRTGREYLRINPNRINTKSGSSAKFLNRPLEKMSVRNQNMVDTKFSGNRANISSPCDGSLGTKIDRRQFRSPYEHRDRKQVR